VVHHVELQLPALAGCGKMSSPMRRIAVVLFAAVSGVTFADGPGVALGYQFVPLLPAGLSLSLLDTFGILGFEATINAGGTRSDEERADRFSGSLGANLATPIDLYPSFAISFQNSRRWRGSHLIERRTVGGLDVKLTGYVDSWIGITVGYRAPFGDPLDGSLILGASLVLLRQDLRQTAACNPPC